MQRAALLLALVALACGCKKSEAASAQSRELFVNACSRCHGADGKGGLPLWEAGPSPRNFTDHSFQRERTDEQLKETIKSGKGSGMPAFGTAFNDEQLSQLVAQIRSFDSEKK